MANGFASGQSSKDGFYSDMMELRKTATKKSAGSSESAPQASFNPANMAKMGMFAEKPLTHDKGYPTPTSAPASAVVAPASTSKNASSSDDNGAAPITAPSNFYDWLFESYKRMEKGDVAGAWEAAQKTLDYENKEPDLFVPLCQQFDPPRRRKLANAAMTKTSAENDAYQYLWVEVALSYWYEGNFTEACAEYETILKQKYLDPCLIPMLCNSLAMCYEALGRYKEAEEKYLEIDNRESVIKARARSGDIEGAVDLMNKGMNLSEPVVNTALKETLLCCLGRPSDKLTPCIADLLALDSDWPYKDFMLGVMELVDGKGAGFSRLERFLRVSNSSEHEWAVTLRWEIGVVNDILNSLG